MKNKIAKLMSWIGIIMVGVVCARFIIWFLKGLVNMDMLITAEIFVFGLILVVTSSFISGQISTKKDDPKKTKKSKKEIKTYEEEKIDKKIETLTEELKSDEINATRQEMLNILGEWSGHVEDDNLADKARLACNELRMYLDEKIPKYKENVGQSETSYITGSIDALACVEKLYYPISSDTLSDNLNDIMYRLERTIFNDKAKHIEPSESELQLILVLCISVSKYIAKNYSLNQEDKNE